MLTTFHLVKKLLLTVSVVVVCMAPISATATSPGRVPPEKTRWFNIESITVDVHPDLPADGFEVRSASSSPHLEFKHTGKNPIFLQIEDASDYDGSIIGYYWEDEHRNDNEIPNVLQFPSVPNYKLVKGKTFKHNGGYPGESNYKPIEENSNWLKIHIRKLDPRIKRAWRKGDGRPEDVVAPESIPFQDKILYSTHHDSQFYDVTGEISFSLNENYRATAHQDAIDAANKVHMDMLRDNMVLPNTLIMIVEFLMGLTIVIFSWLPFV